VTDGVSRAVILGGGGVTGIAWELGVVTGLLDEGIRLAEADAIIGTSAGAFVATEVASGVDLAQRYADQLAGTGHEIPGAMSAESLGAYQAAICEGLPDFKRVGQRLGQVAMKAQTVSTEVRQAVVAARLPVQDWPAGPLKITAIDAETGELHVLDRNSGLTLTEAAAASGAVPGLWPMVTAGGRRWIDGGVCSVANVALGAAYDRVLVIAPFTSPTSGLPTVHAEVAELRREHEVVLISPDARTVEAIGPNVFDPTRRGPAAEAGRTQGRAAAAEVRALWSATARP
jgi:NTE family protein